jgi:hypothetical protein
LLACLSLAGALPQGKQIKPSSGGRMMTEDNEEVIYEDEKQYSGLLTDDED